MIRVYGSALRKRGLWIIRLAVQDLGSNAVFLSRFMKVCRSAFRI